MILAHGGAAGVVVEVAVILAIVLLGVVVWISNRKTDD
jgi:hypothetical protein